MQTIYRVKKDKDNPYVMINKTIFENGLSLKAVGLLSYMLSLPDDWRFYEIELIKHFKDGRSAIRSTMKELIEAGHIVKHKVPSVKGKFTGYDYTIYEIPKPCAKNRHGKTDTDNQTLLSIEELNNKETNTYIIAEANDDSVSSLKSMKNIEDIKFGIFRDAYINLLGMEPRKTRLTEFTNETLQYIDEEGFFEVVVEFFEQCKYDPDKCTADYMDTVGDRYL